MTKTLTYSAFAAASLLVMLLFVSAKTYSHLAVAAVLYPILIFLAFKIFPRSSGQPKITVHSPPKLNQGRGETFKPKTESADVADIDRRIFIKLIGATGISFFLFSLLGRRVEDFFFGRTAQSGINPTVSGDQPGSANTSPTDGYKISEIDEGPVTYYGFIDQTGAWLIMREGRDGTSFRYAKGSSDFPANWQNRENLGYDYFYNLP